jgi:hypothetical protein
MVNELVSDKIGFSKHIISRLDALDLDFVDKMVLIRQQNRERRGWSASGVLVPLEFDQVQKEYVIILNKRSAYVQQPGDLCCPGGGMNHRSDRILGYLLTKHLIPQKWARPFQRLSRLTGQEREIFAVILASILRESWEEMRLNPCNVEYLGGLPTQQMQNFPKFIFPVVGMIRHSWKSRLSWEVERILRVPVRSFLELDNYAIYSQKIPYPLKEKVGLDRWELPCLVIGREGSEEILWGATFKILLHFLHLVMDLPIEKIHPSRKIERDLPPDYFTGRQRD